MTVKEIKEYLDSAVIPEIVELNDCTIILNSKNFYESHIAMLERNKGNKTFLPYYDRLLKFYNIIKLQGVLY